MKFILLGDPHVKPDNIAESRRLLKWVSEKAVEFTATVFIMGDLYDTHGVAKLIVQKFWRDTFMQMNAEYGLRPIILSGNHDMDYECSASWLSAHLEDADVIDHENVYSEIDGKNKIAAIPYIRDNSKFIQIVNDAYDKGYRWILCHQEFDGCQLDNGYYSPNGVDRSNFPNDLTFVSGHIHKRQVLTKDVGAAAPNAQVIYVGTPRQLTRSDIDEIKGIFLWDTEKRTFEFIATPHDVAEPFKHYVITPESQPEIVANGRTYVDVKGPKEFVKEQLSKLPEGVKVRTFPDSEQKSTSVKESDGVPKAFMNYMVEYCNSRGMGNAALKVMVERAYQRCPTLRG
jgi:DNA repair exonuclease SbcCD nuclease subunit